MPLKQHAAGIGLDAAKFEQCLDPESSPTSFRSRCGPEIGSGSRRCRPLYINGCAAVAVQRLESFQAVIDEEQLRVK